MNDYEKHIIIDILNKNKSLVNEGRFRELYKIMWNSGISPTVFDEILKKAGLASYTYVPDDENREIEYFDLPIEVVSSNGNIYEPDVETMKVDFNYLLTAGEIKEALWELNIPEVMAIENDKAAWEYIEENFDELISKYYSKLQDHFKGDAIKSAEWHYSC